MGKVEAIKLINGIKIEVDKSNGVINNLKEQRKQHVSFIRENKESYDLDVLNEVKEHENRLNQVDGAIERAEADRETLKKNNYNVVAPTLHDIIKADAHSQDKEYKELEKKIEEVIALRDDIQAHENKLVDEVRTEANALRPYLTGKGFEQVQNLVYPMYPLKIAKVPEDLNYYVDNIVEHARGNRKL